MGRNKFAKIVGLVFLCIFIQVSSVHAAGLIARRTGKISGVVLDPHQSRIANAVVTIHNSKLKRQIKSGEAGEFEVILPAGVYQLTVESNGFCQFIGESLQIKPGETERVNIHMKISPCSGGQHYSEAGPLQIKVRVANASRAQQRHAPDHRHDGSHLRQLLVTAGDAGRSVLTLSFS